MRKIYAGIGSRSVPEDVAEQMLKLGVQLAELGYILRSGGADGSDITFEVGSDGGKGTKEIYLPWRGFNNNNGIDSTKLASYEKAKILAEKYHPGWKYLNEVSRKFHTRNVYQILGESLNDPVDFVICYTWDGKPSGGTGQAMRIAYDMDIPIYNLFYKETYEDILNIEL
jgi:hypothetical protein